MKWSWRIGTFAGIGVYIHATFLLIIGWVALISWQESHTLVGALFGVVYILLLFGCVVLHEYGHALTARKYGIATRDITLLPIGGVARLERMPDDPRQELWVALAGPAVNILIAMMLFVWIILTIDSDAANGLEFMSDSLVARLMSVNILLAAFNMIPAFPMDGGRVVRALLATRISYTRATQIAAGLGQAVAFVFFLIGLFYQPWLMLIGLFVWIGAGQEASMVQLKSALHGIPVSRAMLTDFRVITPDNTLREVVELILTGSQQDFPVMDQDRVVGVLMQNDLLAALAQEGTNLSVADVMRLEFEVAHPHDMLHTLFVRMQDSACDCRTVPVLQDEQLVGLVTKGNIGEFLAIQAALSESKKGLSARTA